MNTFNTYAQGGNNMKRHVKKLAIKVVEHFYIRRSRGHSFFRRLGGSCKLILFLLIKYIDKLRVFICL